VYDPLADRWLLSEFAGSGNPSACTSETNVHHRRLVGLQLHALAVPGRYQVRGVARAYCVTSNRTSPAAALDRAKDAGRRAPRSSLAAPNRGSASGATRATSTDRRRRVGSPAVMARHRDDEVRNPSRDPRTSSTSSAPVDFDPGGLRSRSDPHRHRFDSSLCGLTSFRCFKQPTGTTARPHPRVVMWLAYRNFGDPDARQEPRHRRRGGPGRRALVRAAQVRCRRVDPLPGGTLAPDTNNRWMGSLAMDRDSNLALAYNVVSLSVFPASGTGRLALIPRARSRRVGPRSSRAPSRTTATATATTRRCPSSGGRLHVLVHGRVEQRLELEHPDRAFKFPELRCRAGSPARSRRSVRPGTQMTAAQREQDRRGRRVGRIGLPGFVITPCTTAPVGLHDDHRGDLLAPPSGRVRLAIPDGSFWVIAGSGSTQICRSARTRSGAEEIFSGWRDVRRRRRTTATCP
jgi:hypothetical protein